MKNIIQVSSDELCTQTPLELIRLTLDRFCKMRGIELTVQHYRSIATHGRAQIFEIELGNPNVSKNQIIGG